MELQTAKLFDSVLLNVRCHMLPSPLGLTSFHHVYIGRKFHSILSGRTMVCSLFSVQLQPFLSLYTRTERYFHFHTFSNVAGAHKITGNAAQQRILLDLESGWTC